MWPALVCIAIGAGFVIVRHPWARGIAKSQAFWFDRTVSEAGVAWGLAFIGSVVALFGVVFAALSLAGR
jgi:hypothetical protein